MFQFTPCGLVFDVAGIILLGWAFFGKTFDTAFKESSMNWDNNRALFIQITKSKFDGMFGTSMLFIGFLYQLFGYLKLDILDCYQAKIVSCSYIFLIIFLCVYWAWFRKKIVDIWFMRAKRRVEG